MKKILVLSLFVAVLSSCSAMLDSSSATVVTLSGNVQKLGITTYQYGTHIINYGGKPYALKSSSLNLDTYVDKQVQIKGTKVSGYPLENGPELIEVTQVVVK